MIERPSTLATEDDGWLSDQDYTPIACRACSGNYKVLYETAQGNYRIQMCRWCTRGGQSPAQLAKWQEHRVSGVMEKP